LIASNKITGTGERRVLKHLAAYWQQPIARAGSPGKQKKFFERFTELIATCASRHSEKFMVNGKYCLIARMNVRNRNQEMD